MTSRIMKGEREEKNNKERKERKINELTTQTSGLGKLLNCPVSCIVLYVTIMEQRFC